MTAPLHDHPHHARRCLTSSMAAESGARDGEVRAAPPPVTGITARVVLDRQEATVQQVMPGQVAIENQGTEEVRVSDVFVHAAPDATCTGWSSGHSKPVVVPPGITVSLPISLLAHHPQAGFGGLRYVIGATVRLSDGNHVQANATSLVVHSPF